MKDIYYKLESLGNNYLESEVVLDSSFPSENPIHLTLHYHEKYSRIDAELFFYHGKCVEEGAITSPIAEQSYAVPDDQDVRQGLYIPEPIRTWVREPLIDYAKNLQTSATLFVERYKAC